MPRGSSNGTTKKPLTPKRAEILDLHKNGLNATEIAARIGVSTGAVYQDLSRLRAAGRLKGGQRKPPQDAQKAEVEQEFDAMIPPNSNGNGGLSVAEHIAHDLGLTQERLKQIAEQRAALETEEGTLVESRDKLAAAQTALA